jgi:hypothetical protein
MANLARYRTFIDSDEADELLKVLDRQGIPYRVDRDKPAVDLNFGVADPNEWRILVFIPADLFADADRALEALAVEAPVTGDADHYLNDFSDKELLELVRMSHEWSPADGLTARRMLVARGVEIDEQEIAATRQESLAASHEPVAGNEPLIAVAYVLALLGGILGFLFGWSYATMKDRDRAGRSYHHYDEATRKHGVQIMVISVVCLGLWMYHRFS